MKFGIDVLLSDKKLIKYLKQKRVSVLAHPASVTATFSHTVDALTRSGVTLTSAFGPQHGMRGDKQDNMVETEDFIDPVLGIPVFSLYGEVRRPTSHMMDSFDILLVDLQDLGCRIYTFITTLLYVMEECSKHKREVWVLDRPNPAGRPIEGMLLEKGWESFVGAAEIPMRHGLTMGELALWYKDHFKMDLELRIVKMKGYNPKSSSGFGWPKDTPWVNPSPNAANLNMARSYAGTVMIEGTTFSEGRGTTRALETLGAPDIDALNILKKMNSLAPKWLQGCKLRECHFSPTFHKHVGKLCHGFQIHAEIPFYDHLKFKPYRLVSLFLKSVRTLYPDYPIWRDFHYEYETDRLAIDVINGGPRLRSWVDDSEAKPSDLDKILKTEEGKWIKEIGKRFLIY